MCVCVRVLGSRQNEKIRKEHGIAPATQLTSLDSAFPPLTPQVAFITLSSSNSAASNW